MPYQCLLEHAAFAPTQVIPWWRRRRRRFPLTPNEHRLLCQSLYFAHYQGWHLRRQGRPLSPQQRQLARRMGVHSPQRVRLLWRRHLPRAYPMPLRATLVRHGLAAERLWGFTLGYAMVLHPDAWGDPGILAHELVHVAQYERLGQEGFTHLYLQALLRHGYEQHPLEHEAEALARRFCHRLDPAPSSSRN